MTEPRFNTAEKRWAGIGPYYAMFPIRFADEVIKQYTRAGDIVLDPFAGRSTSIYSAAIQGRIGIGIEVNPVGWIYGKTKLFPADLDAVEKRLSDLADSASNYSTAADQLPEFFHICFSKKVRSFLLAGRDLLKWKYNASDWTLMGILLVYLHGKYNDSLSNQMRQTKSMSPAYAIRWWNKRNMVPPDIDPLEFMLKRIRWRYAKGKPKNTRSKVYLGDCNKLLSSLPEHVAELKTHPVRLLLTSPPYFGVTNYHYDQWLRLWLLGYPETPNGNLGKYRDKFQQPSEYKNLLCEVFRKSANLTNKDSIIYVRTDAREFTYNTTLDALKVTFPDKKMVIKKQPFHGTTQTHLFGDHSQKQGEIDIILN